MYVIHYARTHAHTLFICGFVVYSSFLDTHTRIIYIHTHLTARNFRLRCYQKVTSLIGYTTTTTTNSSSTEYWRNKNQIPMYNTLFPNSNSAKGKKQVRKRETREYHQQFLEMLFSITCIQIQVPNFIPCWPLPTGYFHQPGGPRGG